MRKFCVLAVFAIFLTGCVTAVGTSFGPADAKGFGYEDMRIEENRYRVVFRGDGATPPGIVESFALRRAAELTVENGYDWFRIVSQNLSGDERGGVGVGAGFGTGSYGRGSGVSVGVGGDLGTIGAKRFYTSRLEVLMGNNPQPESGQSSGAIYDARSVLEAAIDF